MSKAIYAFSGDPITYGHIDIIKRSAKVFDELIVGIGANPDKKYMFCLEERTSMAEKSLTCMPNVDVVSFQGLLVDYAYEHCIPTIVKGVRNSADFNYESVLHEYNKSQKLGIDTHILFARPELAHVSSSAVKGVLKEQGFIHESVPLYVKQCLEKRMLGQYLLGITGEIGVGKSYVGKKLEDIGKTNGVSVHNVELDEIGHKILSCLEEPKYQEVRQTVVETFGEQLMLPDGQINRKALGEIVFNDQDKLEELNKIMHDPIMVRLRRELYGKKGLVLFNAALLAESEMGYLCNNNHVLVTANKESQERRLRKRGLSSQQIERRLGCQYSTQEKKEKIEATISRDKQGKLWTFNNSDQGMKEAENPEYLFSEIVEELKIS